MKIFIFGELNASNVKKICPDATILKRRTIKGYTPHCSKSGKSFIKEGDGEVRGVIVDCSPADLWNLDQWKDVLFLRRKALDKEVSAYFPIYETQDEGNPPFASEKMIDEFVARDRGTEHASLKMADVHMLIPGYCTRKPEDKKGAVLGHSLQEAIGEVNSNEFNSDFLKESHRYALGKIEIVTKDGYVQDAVLTLMSHKVMHLCVIDIFVPAIVASTHEVLESYCGDFLKLKYEGRALSIDELCDLIGVKQCGARRSMVFSYELIKEEPLLNLLVNEESPMGKIMGTHFKNIVNTNIAQYDTAEVYVSSVTMVEMTDKIENDLDERIKSQAVEIFFVEMLLLQDAAVSKMYERVQREIEIERANPLRKDGGKIIAELIDEAAYTANFTDYQQFYYPTVRVSAKKVAKAFGMDEITKRYERNRKLLEQMIKDHNTEIERKENRIKNSLLIILTLLSGIKTIYEAFNNFTGSKFVNIAYYVAVAVMIIGIIVYFGIRSLARRQMIKNAEKKLQQRKDEDYTWHND